ncbi:MAG: GH25 family lysozyme [Pseudonocardiaceae bacterium]
MTLYGVDIHPRYQAGISIEQIRAEGFEFMACKVSEGTTVYDSQDWLRRGRKCGLLCLGYHYLSAGNEDAQARVFAGQLTQAGVPGMLDVEDGSGNIGNVRSFLDACRVHHADVRLLYLPHWYWHDHMGSPDLSGLPPLWASSYVAGGGHASTLYENVNDSRWAGYGGLDVAVLQFTDEADVAGYHVDADAYRGSRQQLAALLAAPLTPTGRNSIPAMEYGQTSDAIRHLQDWLNQTFPAYSHIDPVSGYYGDQTTQVVAEFQRRVGIIGGDGRNCGPQTRGELSKLGFSG